MQIIAANIKDKVELDGRGTIHTKSWTLKRFDRMCWQTDKRRCRRDTAADGIVDGTSGSSIAH